MTRFLHKTLLMACVAGFAASPVMAQDEIKEIEVSRPALVITSEPVPAEIKSSIYSRPSRTKNINSGDFAGDAYYQPTQTLVTSKINELQSDLNNLQGNMVHLSESLASLKKRNATLAADYYASVATVNTQLQSGTTPGNPRLVRRLEKAESNLEQLAGTVNDMNQLAMEASDVASKASFLLDSTHAAYNISGAVEEDHTNLAQLEDSINNTVVTIERILSSVNDDISRTTTYLATERQNLRTLSLAVSNGDLYGRSLSNMNYVSSDAPAPAMASPMMQNASFPAASAPASAAPLSQAMPLAKIRFDRPDVEYQEPVYNAVNQALQRYPNANFNLIAVHPTQGNAAEVAIESTRARRNAEKVLRSLTQMGLDTSRITLSYEPSAEATTSEVHLYIR